MGYGDFNFNQNSDERNNAQYERRDDGRGLGLGLGITNRLTDELSPAKYNLTIGLVLFWGFLMNYLAVKFIDPMVLIENGGAFIGFIIGYIALVFAGSMMCRTSDNPLISFVGYNMIVLPLGLVISMALMIYQDDYAVVQNALLVTVFVTVVMMILGAAMPQVFSGIISYITGTLLVTIIAEILISLISGYHFEITDYIVAVMFCGYIGYDWGRAQAKIKTVDSAVDSAAELYLDIINLFIRLLSIMGSNSRRSK